MKESWFIRTLAWVAVLAVSLAPASLSAAAGRDLSKAEIAKLGKTSTALVVVKISPARPRYGSAFCINPSGLFITTKFNTFPPGKPLALVVNSGLETQQVLDAKVVRRDPQLGLALLRVEGADELSALALGSVEDLEDRMELVAFGYPFGKDIAVAPGQYPAVSFNAGSVTSLLRKEGELSRIQLDAELNPGNSGGPVLDRNGEVVGIVDYLPPLAHRTGVKPAAIPVSHLRRFVAEPEIKFTPPVVNRANMHEPVEFRAGAVAILPSAEPLDLELILSTREGDQRKHKMELTGGAYRVTAVPIPPPKDPPLVRLDVKYADGSASGKVADRTFKIGAKTVKLSNVRRLRFGPKTQAVLYDGTILEDDVSGFAAVPVQIGGESQLLDLTTAVEIKVDASAVVDSVSCAIVASRAGKEVGRLRRTLTDSAAKAGFYKPSPSASPTTYLRAVTVEECVPYSHGPDLSVTRKTQSADNFVVGRILGETFRKDNAWGGVAIETPHPAGFRHSFGAPAGQLLAVGEYDDVRASHNSNVRTTTRFVVWELEVRENQVVRLAIDFTSHFEQPDAARAGILRYSSTKGSIRFHSSFE